MLVGMKKDYSEMEQVLNTARFHQAHLHCHGRDLVPGADRSHSEASQKQLNTTLDKSGKEQLQAAEIRPRNGTKASGRVQGAFFRLVLKLAPCFYLDSVIASPLTYCPNYAD